MGKRPNKDLLLLLIRCTFLWLIYYLIVDRWIEQQFAFASNICLSIAFVSQKILHVTGLDVLRSGNLVGIHGTPGILLIDSCSGIGAMGLFLGFILAFRNNLTKRIIYSIAGLLTIYVANIQRILILILTQAYFPNEWEIAHQYLTVIIFYLLIFALWTIWVRGFTHNTEMAID